MATIACRITSGTLTLRPEVIAVPSEVTFAVSGLPAGQACDLLIADPQTHTVLASAAVSADGAVTVNTNTTPFRALFAGDRGAHRHVIIQIGTPSQLFAAGIIAARWNMIADDSVPPAPDPETRWLTDADLRDVNSRLDAAIADHQLAVRDFVNVLDDHDRRLGAAASSEDLTALETRIAALEAPPTVDEVVLGRVQDFDPATATIDQLWQQVADLSLVVRALLK